jgi:hypothetical protein
LIEAVEYDGFVAQIGWAFGAVENDGDSFEHWLFLCERG